MKKVIGVALIALSVGTAACAMDSTDDIPEGNTQLGVARFEVDESADQSAIRGFDADGREVASVVLIHGRFTVSPGFRDQYDTPEVVGRQLDVVANDQRFQWETEGFTPTLEMPAHPRSASQIAALVEDPHVKPMLSHWLIGWRHSQELRDGEVAQTYYGWSGGADGADCGSSDCGYTPKGRIGMCGGADNAYDGRKLTEPNYATADGWQVAVAQCCPGSDYGSSSDDWAGVKTCPERGNVSSCGTSVQPCAGCGGYGPSNPNATIACSAWGDDSSMGLEFF